MLETWTNWVSWAAAARGDLRVGMAQVDHRQPGQAVQVLFAGIVPDPAALALDQHQRLPAVGVHDDFVGSIHPIAAHDSHSRLLAA